MRFRGRDGSECCGAWSKVKKMSSWTARFACLLLAWGSCSVLARPRADYFVSLTENIVSTPATFITNFNCMQIFDGSTADFSAITTVTDTYSPPISSLISALEVQNNSSHSATLSIEIEDTGPGNAGFTTPNQPDISLYASIAGSVPSAGNTITMQSGLSSPLSNTPNFLTSPVLNLTPLGAVSNSNDIMPTGATYALFSFLTFTLGPHVVESGGAATTAIGVPEPRAYLSLIGIICTFGLCFAVYRRRSRA